jgi:hypothetical protein
VTTPTRSAIVRYAVECAALASWLTGSSDERLIEAAEAADREDWLAVRRLCRDAAHVASADYDADVADYAAAAAGAALLALEGARASDYAAAAVRAAARAGYAAAREPCARRARELLLPDAPDARTLRLAVAAHIEAHPELHDQAEWGDGSADPSCGTPCCVAGWACHLGGGAHGLPVALAGAALLYLDGAPLPSFAADATRKDILRDLRGAS